ncbi:14061_t:CDS:2 [Cetraspora pellucida]|uniref:14061_t:CDS:1 n=1 Tax=Cetraspora pellucida TaxID=1433469 RepID=A0A9N9GD55_9GLOM|nr:14061_t:CDS:2 [Cetraspora pellucida]
MFCAVLSCSRWFNKRLKFIMKHNCSSHTSFTLRVVFDSKLNV